MNITQIMASYEHGGAQLFFCRLVNALAERGINQSVLMHRKSPYVEQLLADIPRELTSFSGLLKRRALNSFDKLLTNYTPDIVLTWMNRASSLAGKRYKHHFKHVARLGGYYKLKYYRHVDHFIGNTKGICDYLIQSGVSARKVHFISNFVYETPGTLLARPNDKPLLVTLGRLHPSKAFDTLIEAMTHIKDAELWIGGTGALEQTLKHTVQQHQLSDRIKFLGWVNNPEDVIATSDLFICPSRFEPLGNVILEAWAQKKPVIATRNQGAVENITDGQDGLLTPIDDPKALATAINQLLTDTPHATQIAANGQERYQRQFSQKAITDQYVELFNTII